MYPITERFADSATAGAKLLTKVSCAAPGGEAVPLEWTAGSITCDMSSASRYTAPLRLTPSDRIDVFDLVTTPGARFTIDTGFDYGGAASELIPMGRYELARDSADMFGGEISVDLVDDWAKLARAEYDGPYSPGTGLRAQIIADAVQEAIPDVSVDIRADGGIYTAGDLSWESRTTLISDMAKDGGLDCYFDGAGTFVIRLEPTINAKAPVWTFRSGAAANIVSGDRTRPFDQFYNRVIVLPMDESQTWAAQIVEIVDTQHPLHKSKYGVSTYKYRSPGLDTAAAALAAAATILRRVMGTPETLSFGSFGMSALEAGDTVSIAAISAATGKIFTAAHMLDAFTFDLATASLSASTRSTDATEIEEAA